MSKKNDSATLLGINNRWRPPALVTSTKTKNHDIVYGLFPDIIDPNKSDKPIYFTDNAVKDFANGCWREGETKISYLSSTETLQVLYAITSNAPITYKGGKHRIGCRDNMINKIGYLISQSDLSLVTPLFTDVQLHPFPENHLSFRPLFLDALEQLYQLGTRESLTYGVFLLVLHAVFHEDMHTISFLYSGSEFRKTLAQVAPKTVRSDLLPENHTYLVDKQYSHRYYAYMFRDNYDLLYEDGCFDMTCQGGIPSAVLEFRDSRVIDPSTQVTDPVHHRYEGIPIMSKRDDLIYIVMNDANDQNAVGILMFQYTSFSNEHNCYFRSGLFLSSDHRHCPEVRKIVLTEEPQTEEMLPVVEGILKTSGQQVVLSEQQMDAFCEKYGQRYGWIKGLKDMIPPHLKNWYCFKDDLLDSIADSSLTDMERLKLTLAFRSYCKGAGDAFTRVHCKEKRYTYKIMR